MQIPWSGKEGIWWKGGRIYREPEDKTRGFALWGFLENVRFRFPVGFKGFGYLTLLVLSYVMILPVCIILDAKKCHLII